VRIALILEYNGQEYCGWQKQLQHASIQTQLESALSRIACSPVHVVAAGRTDAGVHALYQVVHFDTHVQRPLGAWVRGANAWLPGDISVLWASQVSSDFHARFSAIERTYLYRLLNRPARPGACQGKVGWIHDRLDLEKMRAAARMLMGAHDFSAFRSSECQAKSPVRQLTKLEINCQGHFFLFEFRANAFLHHMVRNILGSLIYVGKGKYPPEWVQMLLEQRDRKFAAPTFSPDGLYLAGVRYDSKWNFPACGTVDPVAALHGFWPPAII
jgi:tRNA pseudouridine38-40 synthase